MLSPLPCSLLLAALSWFTSTTWGCNQVATSDGYVCVCDEDYCDTVPSLDGTISNGNYTILSTSYDELGFASAGGPLARCKPQIASVAVVVGNTKRQTVLGFGGAMTDAAALNIDKLSDKLKEKLMESYYGEDGSKYTMLRMPIGGSDYSTRFYTYDDDHPDDRNLTYFQLQPEDIDHKIPNIQQALKLRNGTINIYASVWTPPLWMKNYQELGAYSLLKYEYYQLLADYMVKCFEEYGKHGIKFWGVTTGNEPLDGFVAPGGYDIPAMGWVPYEQMDWLINNLGPTMRKFQDNLKILIHDDSTPTLPHVVPLMLNNTEALNYIDGVGVHIYADSKIPHAILNLAETDKKQIFHIMTEACYMADNKVWLGSWTPAEMYSSSIIQYLRRGYNSWVDWNLVVDMRGGPSFIGNIVHAPIIVSDDAQKFYKNPAYYVMAHFSKYLEPGSVILESTLKSSEEEYDIDKFEFIAFERPDGLRGVIAYNGNEENLEIQVRDRNASTDLLILPGYSINTVLYSL